MRDAEEFKASLQANLCPENPNQAGHSFCNDEQDLSSSLEHLDAQQELGLSDDNLVKLTKIL
jgi:hypothetical protein